MFKTSRLFSGALAVSAVILPFAVSAQSVGMTTAKPGSGMHAFGFFGNKGMLRNATVGTVASVNGDLITLNAKRNATTTVDASAATITNGLRNGGTITAADIQVGDRLLVAGTTNGSIITATVVKDLGQNAAMGMHEKMRTNRGWGHGDRHHRGR